MKTEIKYPKFLVLEEKGKYLIHADSKKDLEDGIKELKTKVPDVKEEEICYIIFPMGHILKLVNLYDPSIIRTSFDLDTEAKGSTVKLVLVFNRKTPNSRVILEISGTTTYLEYEFIEEDITKRPKSSPLINEGEITKEGWENLVITPYIEHLGVITEYKLPPKVVVIPRGSTSIHDSHFTCKEGTVWVFIETHNSNFFRVIIHKKD